MGKEWISNYTEMRRQLKDGEKESIVDESIYFSAAKDEVKVKLDKSFKQIEMKAYWSDVIKRYCFQHAEIYDTLLRTAVNECSTPSKITARINMIQNEMLSKGTYDVFYVIVICPDRVSDELCLSAEVLEKDWTSMWGILVRKKDGNASMVLAKLEGVEKL